MKITSVHHLRHSYRQQLTRSFIIVWYSLRFGVAGTSCGSFFPPTGAPLLLEKDKELGELRDVSEDARRHGRRRKVLRFRLGPRYSAAFH